MARSFVESRYPSGFSPTGAPVVVGKARLLAATRQAEVPVYFTEVYAEGGHVRPGAPRPAPRSPRS